jgi:di/tricarboxylate transporter
MGMLIDHWIIFGTLLLTLVLFITGRWRYDLVALMALLTLTLTGLIPPERTFSGFSNPAVITVAAVLVVSRGLQNSGVVELIGQRLARLKGGIIIQLAALTSLVMVLSAFMNNVGALALLLPVTIQLARRKNISPSVLLMPLAFASLLGGMTTLIGTPPNIIVASFREDVVGEPLRMFDFTPVGLGVALGGVIFITLLGWRLIPKRVDNASSNGMFNIEKYFTEVRVPEDSKQAGRTLSEFRELSEAQAVIVGLVRGKERRMAPHAHTKLQEGDILTVRIDTENLENLVNTTGLELVGSEAIGLADLESDEVNLSEAVVMPNSMMIGGSARSLNLRRSFGVNLLAISRQGARLRSRLDRISFQMGDVLLLQGPEVLMKEIMANLGTLPLAVRGLRLGQPRRIVLSVLIFIAALGVAALGLIPVQVAFVTALVAMIVARLLSLREAYESIDWPIIILLGAMIPVGEALETTGAAQLIAEGLLNISSQMPPAATLAVVLIGTMFLSDLVNNAAAVVLMAPIGIGVAQGLNANVDPFLIAVAIGASCAFLTPIGHQSNTLVMGPGSYKFGDYWRMGLPLEIIVVIIAIPLILLTWPLGV